VLLIFAAAGGYRYATRPPAVDVDAQLKAEADAKAQVAAAAKAEKDQAELERLRAEETRRQQQAHDEELKRQAAADARQKLIAEEAAQKKADDEAKAQAAAQEAARQKALESDKTHAAEVEAGLRLGLLDRQHVQVALTALGFNTNGTDGVFGQHTHDMVAAWQKTRSYPETGYLTGPQNQELLRTASAAVAKFDDDQKKAAAAAPPAVPPAATPQSAPPQSAAPQTAASAAPPAVSGSPDGVWTGTYQCGSNGIGAAFTMPVRMAVQGGHGVHIIPVASPTQSGNHALAVTITGKSAFFQRTFVAAGGKNAGTQITTSLNARFEGGTITGTGPESQGNRVCTVILTR
jgi:hypothetical protein